MNKKQIIGLVVTVAIIAMAVVVLVLVTGSKEDDGEQNLNSNVTKLEKQFLIAAATRHYCFNYSKIADYYAYASPEMQELMEDSALVIIDFNDAIAKGYVKLNKRIEDILEERIGDD